jgi:hypothetical protein
MQRRLYLPDPGPMDQQISQCLDEFKRRHPGCTPIRVEVRAGAVDPATYRHSSGVPVVTAAQMRASDVAIYSED